MPDIQCTTLFGKVKLVPIEKIEFRPAAYAILIKDNKILLMRMKRTEKYFFPGGGVEKGEKLEDGLRREAREETGLEIEINKFFYLCTSKTLDLISDEKVEDYEAEKPRWLDLDTLKESDMQGWGWEVIEKLKYI